MSSISVEHHPPPHYSYNETSYNEFNKNNEILMNWLIGTMTVIIVTYTILLCYYFKILQFICKRALRKHGKMITIGELNATTQKKETESNLLSKKINV